MLEDYLFGFYTACYTGLRIDDMSYYELNSCLLDSLFWAGDRVLKAIVLVDGLPELSESVVLLQGVGSFGLEILVHSWLPHSSINHIRLSRQILEWPTVRARLANRFTWFDGKIWLKNRTSFKKNSHTGNSFPLRGIYWKKFQFNFNIIIIFLKLHFSLGILYTTVVDTNIH